ncbi:MAG: hypothetical protein B7L53_06685 [Thermofilum sp. NZ13]|nr:MAG: hypothetical protein B7L53_06685 [Thermofilum sp. NZ13]
MGCALKCPKCGREYELGARVWRCECASPLQVLCDPFQFKPAAGVRGMWRYRASLPLVEGAEPVTLGEGGTPVVRLDVSGVRLHLKLEYLNPTGSFKDRGSSLTLTNLKASGVTEVVEDSSGNAGASISAYSAAAGVRCRVYTPASAPQGKKLQVRLYGANLIEVPGDRGEAARRALGELAGAFYASHLWSPFFPEANATIAYEFYEEVGVPDAVVAPVGSGGLILGIHLGFRRLSENGYADAAPRLYGVQSAANPVLYEALYGRRYEKAELEVVAEGVMVREPPRLEEVVESIRGSGGGVVVVGKEEVAEGLRFLAKRGLLVEPTSATVIPAVVRLKEEGLVDRGESILAPLTGSGLKALDKVESLLREAVGKP